MRIRFTIVDLLWLSLVVALAVGWWLDHRKITTDAADQISALRVQMMMPQQEERVYSHQADALRAQLAHEPPQSSFDNMPNVRPRYPLTIPNTVPRENILSDSPSATPAQPEH